MKKNVLSFVFAIVLAFTATAKAPIEGDKKQVKVKESTVTWKGYKVTGSHEGTINLKEGSLEFSGKKLIGGSFVVDMTTINTTDLKAGKGKEKLDGHLHSEDFFATAKHATATLTFTKVVPFNKNSYTVDGNLTIKGITKPITFVVSIYENKASVTLKVDRTKYNIKYSSGSFFENLGDKVIYDEFDLVADLSF